MRGVSPKSVRDLVAELSEDRFHPFYKSSVGRCPFYVRRAVSFPDSLSHLVRDETRTQAWSGSILCQTAHAGPENPRRGEERSGGLLPISGEV